MKGIVFALLEAAVVDEHGEDVWDDLLDETGLEGAYTAVGTYDQDDLNVLVEAAARRMQLPSADVLVWFGRRAMPQLVARYPQVFEGFAQTRDFVLTLNDVIHPEVRKLFPGAYAPNFEFETSVPGELTMSYHSYRGLCRFAEGLVHGAADHYGEVAVVTHQRCALEGADVCLLHLAFTG